MGELINFLVAALLKWMHEFSAAEKEQLTFTAVGIFLLHLIIPPFVRNKERNIKFWRVWR